MSRLTIRVQPRAKGNEVSGWEGEALKIRLTAPPVEGKANKALVAFLAEKLGISKADVTIVTGQSGRTKIVELAGLGEDEALRRLGVEPRTT